MEARLKESQSRSRNFGWLIVCLITVFLIHLFSFPARAARENQSLMFVVDSSEKMEPHLSGIQEAILALSLQSLEGDYIGIISFSEAVRQLGIKKISGPRDREYIGRRISSLRAGGDFGNIIKGLGRAAEDLGILKHKGDKNRKGIIIISCSASGEGESLAEGLGEVAAEIAAHVKDDNEWFIQYCYFGGGGDPQIKEFVSSNKGFSYDIDALRSKHGTELVEEIYGIISSPQELYTIKVQDLSGILLWRESEGNKWIPLENGSTVAENAQLRVASDSRGVIVVEGYGFIGLSPDTNLLLSRARKNPVTGQTSVRMTLNEGSLWINNGQKQKTILEIGTADSNIEFSGNNTMAAYSSDTNELGLASFSESLSVQIGREPDKVFTLGLNQALRLGNGEITEEAGPAAPYMLEKWKSWSKTFAGNSSLASLDFTVPVIVFPEKTIQIGPIKAGDSQTQSFPILLKGVTSVAGLKLDLETSLFLPEGLALSTGIADGDDEKTKRLMLTVDGSAGFSSGRAEKYTGLLRIVPAKNSKIVFEKIPVPITVETKGPLVPVAVLLVGGLVVILGICAIGASTVLRSKQSARPKAYRVIGRLVVVNDPTGGRVGTINLEDVSTKSSRLSLAVGRDRASEIRLKHASVSHAHCSVEAYVEEGKVAIYIEPTGSAKVRVDGEVIRSRTRLNDGSRINIGEFAYQFEDSQLYKKVDVIYRNGRRMSGILDAMAMDAEGFRLSPIDAVSPSERARVNFADIRQITFYRRPIDIIARKPRSTPKLETMKSVELMFRKGNTISGHIQREYSEGQRKYIELLPLDPKSNIDYTVLDSSSVVEKKEI